MTRLIVLLTIASGCVHSDRVTFATSTLSLVCDWADTHTAASQGWAGQHEQNPIMGTNPSARSVDVYFATAIAANAVAWWLLPARVRTVLGLGVTAVQADAIYDNLPATGLCGRRRPVDT